MLRLLSRGKSLVVSPGTSPRTILTGAFRGLRLELDLRFETQVWLGLAEREVHKALRRLSKGIRTAFDIGAAAGEYALYFLRRTQAEKVFAFEPLDDFQQRMRRNLALNQMENNPRLVLSGQFVTGNPATGCVLDSLLDDIASPTLVKMDVDGAEVDILEGASKLLRQPDTRWLIETHSVELEQRCVQLLQSAGYTTRIIPNAWWRWLVPEQRNPEHNRWLIATSGA